LSEFGEFRRSVKPFEYPENDQTRIRNEMRDSLQNNTPSIFEKYWSLYAGLVASSLIGVTAYIVLDIENIFIPLMIVILAPLLLSSPIFLYH